MKKIKVLVKKPAEDKVEIKEIDNTLEMLQREVDGLIEECFANEEMEKRNISMFANEEGKIRHLECNFWLYDKQDVLNGNAIFVKYDENGEDISLNEEDIQAIMKFLEDSKMNDFERFQTMFAIKKMF